MTRRETAPLVVELRGVSKQLGSVPILRSIDFNVRRGERVVVCGPSGSGKSTLIRCISGLDGPDSGTLVVNGTPSVARSVPKGVSMVFQQFNLFPHLTILENCTLGPIYGRREPIETARRRALNLLARVHVAEQANKYPAQLSGGQQQRVAIARALAMEPTIMLFDEPTSSLDPEMVQEVLDVMMELANSGMTMVCVTHEMAFARKVADRIAFIDQGQIVFDGEPSAFFEQTTNVRIGTFLGKVLAA